MMTNRKNSLISILVAVLMVFAMMPMMTGPVFADDVTVYTVTIDPGEGSETPLTISSTTIITQEESRAGNFNQSLGCFFYWRGTTDLAYRFPLNCTFEVPANKEFDCWAANGITFYKGAEVELRDIFADGSKDTTITPVWKDVEPDPTIEYSTPESINVSYGATRTAFDIQATDASFTQGKTECDIELWDSAFTCSENGGSIPFTMNGNGTGDYDRQFYAGGGGDTGYKFFVYNSTTLPYTVEAYIDISSDSWEAAKPGSYTATLRITDGFGGTRNIPLTLAVPVQTTTHTVTYEVVNGTWSDNKTEAITEQVEENQKPKNIPTGMKPADGYGGGSWNIDPTTTSITEPTTFTYTFTKKQEQPVKIAVPTGKTLTYNGKSQTGVASGTGYTLSGTTSATNAGSYQATATLDEGYAWSDGSSDPKTISWKINKAANPLKPKAKTAQVSFKKLKKANQVLALGKVMSFTNKGQGTRTYTLSSAKNGKKNFKKYFAVNKKNGKVTIKKKLKKGTYKVKINVTAAGNGNYNKVTKPVTVTIKVK